MELEGSGYMELRMVGEVRPSSLMLLDITGSNHLQLINFGTTMFECEKFQPAVLFNNGPTSLGFVIILEEGGVGQEIKGDDSKGVPRNLTNCITASPNQVISLEMGVFRGHFKLGSFIIIATENSWNITQ